MTSGLEIATLFTMDKWLDNYKVMTSMNIVNKDTSCGAMAKVFFSGMYSVMYTGIASSAQTQRSCATRVLSWVGQIMESIS